MICNILLKPIDYYDFDFGASAEVNIQKKKLCCWCHDPRVNICSGMRIGKTMMEHSTLYP